MSLLHFSIGAVDPKATARGLADLMGGTALPFPPCPGAWIAFTRADDGTAIEVYPQTARIERGPQVIAFGEGPASIPAQTHIAVASPHTRARIEEIAQAHGWEARMADRGPFTLIEVWTPEGRLIEVLDPEMLAEYRDAMTAARWTAMFGLETEG